MSATPQERQTGTSATHASNGNPGVGFLYKTVPHITLKSIAQNENLDPFFAKHEPILDAQLAACNAFEAFSGTESLPFRAGQHKTVAVKDIDPRGNEVMRVVKL